MIPHTICFYNHPEAEHIVHEDHVIAVERKY